MSEDREKARPEDTVIAVEGEDDAYPMGAWRAWATVAGTFLLQMCSVGPVSSFGVFQDFYTTSFLTSFSASDISWIGSTQLFLELCLGIVGGKLYDAGYCRATIVGGSLIFTFSFFMLSLAKPDQYYQVFLSQGIGMGLGLSLIFVPTCTLILHHFRNRKALAMGILVASAPLGGIIFSIILNQLIHSKPGFAWGVRASAFIITGCFTLGHALTFVPPRLQSPTAVGVNKESSLRYPPYLLTLLSGFIAQLGTYFPIFYVQLFAKDHNVTQTLMFYSLAIMNVGSFFGRIIPNFFADRMGAINVFIVCVALNGLVGFAMLGCGHVVGLVLFCLLYGFFFRSTISLYLPVVAALAPREADMGKTMGVAIAPVGISSLIGPPIIGAILGPNMVWWKGITFASVCLSSASLIELLVKYSVSRVQ
ncbi:hypothetical protein CVT26_012120 [Gymnopilus dilepis]|uniref:Major facilitator superfamily (MFS) profile domain-containing protein n=1 Tax=Gymnopilus dilepis TaxID=231916 RepID=A0A409YGL8_9AGAR|nr:hypothetical protein CVT26_012120 [Gymnopilus dilepis]